jgi:hypothetical protein
MNRPRFDAYSKVILTIIATCLVGLCVDRFTARADAQATQPTTVRYDRVEAKTFVLVNDKGGIDGYMATVDGWPFLRLNSVEGISYIYLDSNGLSINELFKTHIRLGLLEDGTPDLLLYDDERGLHTGLSVSEDGGPALYLGSSWQTRATLALHEDLGPRLALGDGRRDRAVFDFTKTRMQTGIFTRKMGPPEPPASGLVLYDKEGNVIWQAPPD